MNISISRKLKMVIQPKARGFICTSAHPQGCYQVVQEQVEYIKKQHSIHGPQNVLVIGASTGYGLAARIVSTFASGAKTIGVSFEREANDKRTATAGWYNTAAFEKLAMTAGYYAKSINGDAFSDDIKKETAALIRQDMGQIDLIIYSIAAPRRIHPKTGEVFNSVLKPIDQNFISKTVDPLTGDIKEVSIQAATAEEILATEKVMGGEDWALWIDFLLAENLLASNAVTVAFSYIGPELTYPIYKEGTIGIAKNHLAKTVEYLQTKLVPINGKVFISVNKALVTQASAAIPVVPLYISLLFKVMKNLNIHEDCIEQMYRLFSEHLYSKMGPQVDQQGFIRLDDLEMQENVQQAVITLWQKVNSENIDELSDLKGYREEFYRLFGFGLKGIDYQAEVDPQVSIPSLEKKE